MKARFGFAILAVSLLVSSAAFAEVPAKAPKPLSQMLTGGAKNDYETAKALYGDGDFKAAALKFKSAYDTSKDPRLLWNVAACEKAQRHYAKVLEYVRQYEKEGDGYITTADRQDAEDLMKTVEPLVSRVRVVVTEPDATVTVDGDEVGHSPLSRAVLLDVGTRKIRVTKAGFRDFEQTVTLTNAEVTVDAKLRPDTHVGKVEIVTDSGAAIFLDGKGVGTSRYVAPLTSGIHSLRITNKGMRPHQADIVIEDDKTRNIHVSLEKDPSSGGVPAWVWVAGGVAVAGGLAVGGYFLFKPSGDQPLPAPGTIDPGYVYTGRGMSFR